MQNICKATPQFYSNALFIDLLVILCGFGGNSAWHSSPPPSLGSQWLKTTVSLVFLLAITWLLEGLSKQSLGFVNSKAYLAIKASRWRLSQTTCYGSVFAGLKLFRPQLVSSLSGFLFHTYKHIFTADMAEGSMKSKPSVYFPLWLLCQGDFPSSPLPFSEHQIPPPTTPLPKELSLDFVCWTNHWTGRAFLQV